MQSVYSPEHRRVLRIVGVRERDDCGGRAAAAEQLETAAEVKSALVSPSAVTHTQNKALIYAPCPSLLF